MNAFIKKKEYTLGIDVNPRARPFYPADIGKFLKPDVNTENKAKDITKSDTKTSQQ